MKIDNLRVGDEDQLNLFLTGDASGIAGIQLGTSISLSDFKTNNPSMIISGDRIEGGRLYVGYGTLPAAPVPDGPQYFGWIEFSYKTPADGLWINLTNVDVAALPLALKGKTFGPTGEDWKLGYKKPMTDIVAELETVIVDKKPATNKPIPGLSLLKKKPGALMSSDAIIKCTTGETKIIAPNIVPNSYRNYDTYLDSLTAASAELIIHSDVPVGTSGKIFTGSFLSTSNPGDTIISLTSKTGDTLAITAADFSSPIIYKGDGGKLIYNGVELDQNQTAPAGQDPTAEQLIVNSVFRNLVIGMNEGYFQPDIENRSSNFPFMSPFATGNGNPYAEILNHTSNSYGFPYADSNLKVLIVTAPDPVTLTICKDDRAFGFDDAPPAENVISFGNYGFGIGSGSGSLGTIRIGNCRYTPSIPQGADPGGGYSGIFPTLDKWFQMSFDFNGTSPKKHIWIKTSGRGGIVATGCFNSPAPVFKLNNATQKIELIWGANVSWNAGANSPPKPT